MIILRSQVDGSYAYEEAWPLIQAISKHHHLDHAGSGWELHSAMEDFLLRTGGSFPTYHLGHILWSFKHVWIFVPENLRK